MIKIFMLCVNVNDNCVPHACHMIQAIRWKLLYNQIIGIVYKIYL